MLPAVLAGAELSYRDKEGYLVKVTTPVRRAALIQMYEFLPIMDCWDQVAGLSRYAAKDDVMRAVALDRVVKLACLGGGSDVNMERLLQAKPDVVITWTSQPQQAEFMRRRGLKVITVFPESIAELYEVMDIMGRLFDREQRIQATERSMNAVFDLIRSRVASIESRKRLKIAFIGPRPTNVSAGIGINNDMINLVGGVNVAGHIKRRSVDVSLEQLVKWNPDVIFILGRAPYSARAIIANHQWRVIKAVRDGRVYKAPHWSIWSPRLAPLTLWMAARAYPERFNDLNLNAHIDGYFRQVYGVPYSKVERIAD